MSEKFVLDILSINHHACLVVGDRRQNFESLRHGLKQGFSSKKRADSDLWSREYEVVGIDDARSLKELQNTRPIGDLRVVLLSLGSIQTEAQNSLLKLFEEPSSETRFLVCISDTSIFLPTLLSRFHIIKTFNPDSETDSQKTAKEFLVSAPGERLKQIESMIKDKDKQGTETFLNSLEKEMGLQNKKLYMNFFESIFSARRFLRSRSPSIKMILENLCLTLPQSVISKNK